MGAAIFANLHHALVYSNMFKQYEFDGFIVLVILMCFLFYKSEKIGYKTLAILWSILIWCSQISCFIEGGLLLSELLFSNILKSKKNIKEFFIIGSLISLSFIIYYFAWANRMTSLKNMQSIWGWAFFPLIPKNMNDINKAISLSENQIFKHFVYVKETLILFFLGLISFIYKKDKAIFGIYLGFFLLLLASYLKFYPIRDRTCFFVFPLIILILCLYIDNIIKYNILSKITILSTILFMLMYFNDSARNRFAMVKGVHIVGDEIDAQVDYLKKNIKKNEIVYVYSQSVPIFEYKNGFGNLHIGKKKNKPKINGSINNVIFGKGFFNNEINLNILGNKEAELEKILSYDKGYISSSNITNMRNHPFFKRIENLIDELNQNRYLELVQYEYESPLWYFSKKATDCKLDYELSVVNKKKKYGMIKATIRIKNTGKAYLNDPYTQTYLVNTINNDIYPLNRLIAPNESIDIVVYYNKNQKSSFTLRKQFGKICKEKILSN